MGLIRDEGAYHSLVASLPVDAARRIVSYLERDAAGNPVVYRTPLYKVGKEYPSYEYLIDKIESDLGYTEYEELNGIDAHEKENIGPYGPQKPFAEVEDKLEAYFSQKFNPSEEAFLYAINQVKALLPPNSLRPISLDSSFDLMTKGTSLGFPTVSNDKELAVQYLQRARNLTSVEQIYPFIQYSRLQPKGLKVDPKYRMVWGADHVDTIAFAVLLHPCLNALRKIPGFSAWLRAYDVDVEATRILRRANGRAVNSLDYSSFDSSLAGEMIDAVGVVLKHWFIASCHYLIDLAVTEMKHQAIVAPFSLWTGRNGGMPSGCVLTNLVDTLANLIAGYYCAYRNGTVLSDFAVLGDDSAFLFGEELDNDSIACAMDEVGLTCNPDKQFVSRRSLHFLQRWHSLDYVVDELCRGVHSPYRTASGLFGQERWNEGWNEFMHTVRWIMQVENCEWDPRFKELVRFLYNGDKILQTGVDPMVCFRRAGGPEKILSVLHISSFPFNSKDPYAASQFKTVEELRRLQGKG